MQINRKSLAIGKLYEEETDLKFEKESFANRTDLKKVDKCHVKISYQDYGEILRVKISLDADLILLCSYSLEDIPYRLLVDEEMDFTDQEENGNGNAFYEPQNTIDLNPYILGLIFSSIPIKIVKKGVSLPKDGKDYRVLSEKELTEERKNRKDPRFSALDDIDFDE